MPFPSRRPIMIDGQMHIDALHHPECTLRIEAMSGGQSQVYPEYQRPNGFLIPMENSITTSSMSFQLERLLEQEKRRNRTLNFWVATLQDQLAQAESSYKILKDEFNDLHANGSSATGWITQNSRVTTLSPTAESSAIQHSKSMPPPPRADTQGVKRKGENLEGLGFTKRIATRHLGLSPVDRQLSPKSRFSPSTPTAMNF